MEWRRTVLAEEPLGQTLGLGTATSVFLGRDRRPSTFKPDKGTQCISICMYICMQSMFCTHARIHVCMQVLCIYQCVYHITIVRRYSVTSSVALESTLESSATVKGQDYTHLRCSGSIQSSKWCWAKCVGLLTASYIHVEGLPEQGKKQTLFACGGYLRPSTHDAVLGCRLSHGRTSAPTWLAYHIAGTNA